MTNILNWPDYKVLQVSELEHDYQVSAEVSERRVAGLVAGWYVANVGQPQIYILRYKIPWLSLVAGARHAFRCGCRTAQVNVFVRVLRRIQSCLWCADGYTTDGWSTDRRLVQSQRRPYSCATCVMPPISMGVMNILSCARC